MYLINTREYSHKISIVNLEKGSKVGETSGCLEISARLFYRDDGTGDCLYNIESIVSTMFLR
jgi:hypothetical protein